MKMQAIDMMVQVVNSIDSYDLDVWIWYPNVGHDYSSAAGIKKELAERNEVLGKLSRVDGLLVPAGVPIRTKLVDHVGQPHSLSTGNPLLELFG